MFDLRFDKVYLPKFLFSDSQENIYKKKARCNSLKEVEDIYKSYLSSNFKIKSFSIPFNLITLIDFNYRPKEFREDYHKYNHGIYNLLYAPISEHTSKSDDRVKEFIKTKYFETSYFHRYYGNNNRIISVYTKRISQEFNVIDSNGSGGKIEDLDVYTLSLTGVINVIEAIVPLYPYLQ